MHDWILHPVLIVVSLNQFRLRHSITIDRLDLKQFHFIYLKNFTDSISDMQSNLIKRKAIKKSHAEKVNISKAR